MYAAYVTMIVQVGTIVDLSSAVHPSDSIAPEKDSALRHAWCTAGFDKQQPTWQGIHNKRSLMHPSVMQLQ